MNYNQQVQEPYKCNNCFNKIPFGEEVPRWTNDSTCIYKYIFCYSCERGYELSKPYNLVPDLNLDKMKIIETPEFKRWKGNAQFSENAEELQKELDEIRWGLPRTTEKG